MRIISGKYKKRALQSVPGQTARPTTDYMKESLFNIIGSCEGLEFLDLYAGSGSVALEAVSRGAKRAVMVEFSHKSITTIIKNIKNLDCQDKCRVIRKKVLPYLRKCEDKFDIIFLDPPYDRNLVNITLREIYQSGILKENGRIIVEHSNREKLDEEFTEKLVQEKNTRQICLSIF